MKFYEICRYAEERGWKLDRTNGAHHVYVKRGHRPVPVQKHSKEIEGVYLKRILKQFE